MRVWVWGAAASIRRPRVSAGGVGVVAWGAPASTEKASLDHGHLRAACLVPWARARRPSAKGVRSQA
eukprot:361012-Chlamydomonas_euryale.AAC.6